MRFDIRIDRNLYFITTVKLLKVKLFNFYISCKIIYITEISVVNYLLIIIAKFKK